MRFTPGLGFALAAGMAFSSTAALAQKDKKDAKKPAESKTAPVKPDKKKGQSIRFRGGFPSVFGNTEGVLDVPTHQETNTTSYVVVACGTPGAVEVKKGECGTDVHKTNVTTNAEVVEKFSSPGILITAGQAATGLGAAAFGFRFKPTQVNATATGGTATSDSCADTTVNSSSPGPCANNTGTHFGPNAPAGGSLVQSPVPHSPTL